MSGSICRRQDGVNEFFHSSKQDLFYAAVPDYYLSDQRSQQSNCIGETTTTEMAVAGSRVFDPAARAFYIKHDARHIRTGANSFLGGLSEQI
jgi:hypothetical protein